MLVIEYDIHQIHGVHRDHELEVKRVSHVLHWKNPGA